MRRNLASADNHSCPYACNQYQGQEADHDDDHDHDHDDDDDDDDDAYNQHESHEDHDEADARLQASNIKKKLLFPSFYDAFLISLYATQ